MSKVALELNLIPATTFAAVRAGGADDVRLALIADLCRRNALVAVKRAGSGHLGSSFSSLDLVVHLYLAELNTLELGFDHPERDVFFSSKGHDVPGLYAFLHGIGVLPSERLLRLRRLGGLDGHPDLGVPGIEANSGSLGMGLSKGRGIVLAKHVLGRGGRVVVMTGDGELQEGQNWEALQGAAHLGQGRLWAVVDRNALQSDRPTEEILALGQLDEKLRAFGWDVARCDGHDHAALREVFARFRADDSRPKVLIADTIKGRGVSFMEHPRALVEGAGMYRWHAGAPDDDDFAAALAELDLRIESGLHALGLEPELEVVPSLADTTPRIALQGEPESGAGAAPRLKDGAEFVAAAYGDEVLALVEERPDVVVLDADLSSDCRVRGVEVGHPEQFVECGIAEQDMVSVAAGMARHGLIPVVNSFASFLASRANEQIYNQVSEHTKVVYALHYAGLIPAGPGKSHQSIRDASLLGALPGMTVVHPANGAAARACTRWAVTEAEGSVAIRLAIGPSPRSIDLGADWRLVPGRGTTLMEGRDALLIAYGPVLLHETLTAAEILRAEGLYAAVVDLPWLHRVDRDWLATLVEPHDTVVVIDDHAPFGALGDTLRKVLAATGLDQGRTLASWGVEGWPACGTPTEALTAHELDGASLARRVSTLLGR